MSAPIGLPALEARLRQDLDWLDFPGKPWVPPRRIGTERVRDVVVIGGGMAGLAVSGVLRRLGMENHVVLDRAPAGREGPWITYARMETLRSPKGLSGPALGLPALTFRAYYEARFGRDAWEALGKAPRGLWMEYLVWYRRVLGLPVENGVAVEAVCANDPETFAVTTSRGPVFARHLVLATGRDGLGGPFLPAIADSLDPALKAHSADPIDFAALAGRRVAVVGAGASAMDNAATALEAGAARVDLFVRRPDLPRVNKMTGIGSQGVVHGFAGLPDAWKWRFLDYATGAQTPPPRDSTLRVSLHRHAHFHLGSPILSLTQFGKGTDARALIETPKGRYEADFVIFATGFRVDLGGRPELAAFAPWIRLWRDGNVPQDAADNPELAGSPYLGEAFEFLERVPGTCPALARIHCFNFPATLSHGKLTGDIPAISEGADRLARGIARALFVADREAHFAALEAYAVPELLGDEWSDADCVSEADATSGTDAPAETLA